MIINCNYLLTQIHKKKILLAALDLSNEVRDEIKIAIFPTP